MFHKCVRYLSFKHFWHIPDSFSLSHIDSFLTQLLALTHFRVLSNSNLSDFWQSFESDSFPTHFRQCSDTFLTGFCNWHISYNFLTHFGIFKDQLQLRVTKYSYVVPPTVNGNWHGFCSPVRFSVTMHSACPCGLELAKFVKTAVAEITKIHLIVNSSLSLWKI